MKSIKEYVEALPEIYQNIYGHQEYDGESSRHCEEREKEIVKAINNYQKYTGKKELRVLDLGCAQGFYSFTLAKEGCIVDGVDFLDKNVELCNALQCENQLTCSFEEKKITLEMVQEIPDGKYDVIMFYSVVHHICNENGFAYARELFETLAQKSSIMLTELALKEEGYYWSDSLPNQYDDWFANISFYGELAFFETHLSEFKRPLILCSNKYCYVKDAFYKIENYKTKAYDEKPIDLSRRYYTCDNKTVLIKSFHKTQDVFFDEIKNEIDFLKQNEDLNFVPRLIAYTCFEESIVEAVSIKYGNLLWDCLRNEASLEIDKVFLNVLDNCVALEERGYYHGDIRSWNVVVDDQGARLIDFGNISNGKHDKVMEMFYQQESDELLVYDAFVSMVYDAVASNMYETIKEYGVYTPSVYYDLNKLPGKYCEFIRGFLLLDASEKSFDKLRDLYKRTVVNGETLEMSIEEKERVLRRQVNRLSVQSARRLDILVLKQKLVEPVSYDEQIESLKNQLAESEVRITALTNEVTCLRNWRVYRLYLKLRKLV